jgi:ligand-binding SRPBCC domain-containing protein
VTVHHLDREQIVTASLAEAFDFFSRTSNLERITPPWLSFGLLTPDASGIAVGTQIEYRLRVHGIPLRWTSRIDEFTENEWFVDRQVRGPYQLWHHRHEFAAVAGGTRVRDHVDYALPLGVLGELAHSTIVRRDLTRIFDYRRAAVAHILG